MKNKLYYLGILACVITTCGCLFKIMHWPAAGILLVIGLITLAVIFLPLAVRSCYKAEADKKMKIFYILVAIVMAFNFISALFKIMHWSGAGILLMISIPLPFVVLLPVYLLTNPTDKEINYKNLMAMMFFFAYFAAITAFLSMQISTNVIDGFARSAIGVEGKTAVLDENTRWLSTLYAKDSISGNNSTIKSNQIEEEADKLCSKIDEIKKMLIIAGLGKDAQVQKNYSTTDLQETKFMDGGPKIEIQYIADLKTAINNFKALLQKECSPGSPLYNYLNEAFDTSEGSSKGENWENMLLQNTILASAIEKLNLLQFHVRLAAYETVGELQRSTQVKKII